MESEIKKSTESMDVRATNGDGIAFFFSQIKEMESFNLPGLANQILIKLSWLIWKRFLDLEFDSGFHDNDILIYEK